MGLDNVQQQPLGNKMIQTLNHVQNIQSVIQINKFPLRSRDDYYWNLSLYRQVHKNKGFRKVFSLHYLITYQYQIKHKDDKFFIIVWHHSYKKKKLQFHQITKRNLHKTKKTLRLDYNIQHKTKKLLPEKTNTYTKFKLQVIS